MEESALYPQDLGYVRVMVRSRSAIVLEPEKAYLMHSRLEPLVKIEGLVALTELVQKMRQAPYGALPKKVVEAMTTNETSFPRPDPISGVAGAITPRDYCPQRTVETFEFVVCSEFQCARTLFCHVHDLGAFPGIKGLAYSFLCTGYFRRDARQMPRETI